MNETLTLNDLILYLYNETELTESVMVQKAIDTDDEVEEEFANLVAVKNMIDSSLMKASPRSMETVMAYARLTAPLQRI